MELPEELKVQNLSDPRSSKTYTYKTQPTSFSQQKARFEVRQQGIMSANACIQISAMSGMNNGAYPSLIGARSLISEAILSTKSGKVIYHNRHFSQQSVVEVPFRSNTYHKFKAPYLDMSYFSMANATALEPAGTLGTIRPSVIQVTAANGSVLLPQANCVLPTTAAFTGDPDTVPTVQITLAELFPLLYNTQLPVGMMEGLFIDIFFRSDAGNGDVFVPTGAAYASNASPIIQKDLFLLTDHIVYDDPAVSDSIVEKMKDNLTFNFSDVAVQTITLPTVGATRLVETEHDLGCRNYKLLNVKAISLIGAGSTQGVFGKYYSSGVLTQKNSNYIINDSQVYPNNNQNMAENYSRLNKLYDIPANIPKPLYGKTNQGVTGVPTGGQTFAGANYAAFPAVLNNTAVQLTDDMGRPLQNGNSSVRLLYKRSSNNADITTGNLLYYFVSFLRSFSVAGNGAVLVSDYV
jgi:hypothetical protein